MSDEGKISVRIMDLAGGKSVNARLPTNVMVSQLLPALVIRLEMPSNQAYYLVHKQSGKRLADNDTLASANVRDGDTLRLSPEVTAGGSFVVYEYRDVQLLSIALGEGRVAFNYANRYPGALFAIFLYTPADAALAKFIRDNFLTLHHESGHRFFFFIVEQPTEQAWIAAMRQELEMQLGDMNKAFQQIWYRLQRNQFKPLASEKTVTAIRELLRVSPSQMPCAVLFTSPHDEEVFPVPFARLLGGPPGGASHDDMLTMFRALFELIEGVIKDNPPDERLAALQRAIGAGPVGVPARAPVYSPIAMATLTATVEAAIAAVITWLLK